MPTVLLTTEVWEDIELAVDSGASEMVVHEDMLQSVATKVGDASRKGSAI